MATAGDDFHFQPKHDPYAPTVSAESFVATVAVNVDNTKLTDAQFREFVRNTLPIVIYPA